MRLVVIIIEGWTERLRKGKQSRQRAQCEKWKHEQRALIILKARVVERVDLGMATVGLYAVSLLLQATPPWNIWLSWMSATAVAVAIPRPRRHTIGWFRFAASCYDEVDHPLHQGNC